MSRLVLPTMFVSLKMWKNRIRIQIEFLIRRAGPRISQASIPRILELPPREGPARLSSRQTQSLGKRLPCVLLYTSYVHTCYGHCSTPARFHSKTRRHRINRFTLAAADVQREDRVVIVEWSTSRWILNDFFFFFCCTSIIRTYIPRPIFSRA